MILAAALLLLAGPSSCKSATVDPTHTPQAVVDPGPGPAAERASYSVVNEPEGEAWPILSTQFLEVVPADTPFVWANLEPLPQDFVDRLMYLLEPAMKAGDRVYQEKTMSDTGEGRMARDIFGDTFSADMFQRIGVDLSAPFILYGIGLTPVARLRLASPERFVAMVERVQSISTTQNLSPAVFHGQAYWYGEDDDANLTVVAVVGPDLVLAMLPPGEVQRDLLPLVFGQTLPERSMAASGELGRVQERHGLTPHFVGLLNVPVLTRTRFGRSPRGLERKVAKATGVIDSDVTGQCVGDFTRIAAWFPKIVVGFDSISTERISGSLIVEADPAIATRWATVAGPIQGLTADREQEGLMTMGLGLNVDQLTSVALEAADALKRTPLECPDLSEFQDLANDATDTGALPGWVRSVRGASMVMSDLAMDESGKVTKLDGAAVLATSEARAVLDATAMLLPNLDLEALDRPGKAVLFTKVMPQSPSADPTAKTAHVAYSSAGIGWAAGKHAKRRLKQVLAAERPADGTVAMVTMDVARAFANLPSMRQSLERSDDASTRAMLEDVFKTMGRLGYRLRLSEAGAELEVSVDSPRTR